MGDDVVVLRDRTRRYDDGTIARVRILSVPESKRFPRGIKYAMHYGAHTSSEPVIRFDNHHGVDELHIGGTVWEIDTPGLDTLYAAWRAALPAEKREDW